MCDLSNCIPSLTYYFPTAQNGFNLIALIISVFFSLITTKLANAFTSETRKYNSVKLVNESIVRLYPTYAAFYISVFLLIGRGQFITVITAMNILLSLLMLFIFVVTAGYLNNDNNDEVIFKRLCGKPCEDSNCDITNQVCKKEIKRKDFSKACGIHYKFGWVIFWTNVLLSLSPITR
jgi:hypothetical protein